MNNFDYPFTINPDIIIQHLEDQVVLLNPDSGAAFGLDGVSTHVWELMQSVDNMAPVKQQMLLDFEVEEDRLEKDLINFYQQLKTIELIR